MALKINKFVAVIIRNILIENSTIKHRTFCYYAQTQIDGPPNINDLPDVVLIETPETIDVNESVRENRISIEKSKRVSLKSTLKSYLSACIYGDMIPRGHSMLLHYRSKSLRKITKEKNINPFDDSNTIDVSVYNVLIKGWARRGKTFRVKELFHLMKQANISPNSQSYAYHILSLSKQIKAPSSKEIKTVLDEMKKAKIYPEEIFSECSISIHERDQMINLIRTVDGTYQPNLPYFPVSYNCKLLKSLQGKEQKYYDPVEGVNVDNLVSWSKEQFNYEIKGNVAVRSIVANTKEKSNKNNDKQSFYRQKWESLEKEWKNTIKEAFLRHIKILQFQSNAMNSMTIYPYLTVMDAQYYTDAIIDEIRLCAQMSEYYSPSMSILYNDLGKRVMLKYLIKTQLRDGIAQDKQELYEKFLDYYKNPDLIKDHNPREFWHNLMIQKQHYYNSDLGDKIWPVHVQIGVGNFLYNLLLREIKIDTNILRGSNSTNKRFVPAFYTTYKCIGDGRYKLEIRAHPTLYKLYQYACLENLYFGVEMLPMVSPPLPWISPKIGGYLLTKTDFVRTPNNKWNSDVKNQNLYPSIDSLNSLSMCPWIVNNKVLDVAISIFKDKGDLTLAIPKPQSEFPPLPKIPSNLPKQEKVTLIRQREIQKREQAEMYSLWCDCLYKLSIANFFRNRVFWFPNNLDFRGRVYPVPPHFNHLGNDMARGILLFAKGQKLGPHGFDWLKIHLVNLTGLKKRSSIEQRLLFANEIMPLILDSADHPLDGQKWWMQSDEPWQTLACCMEIAAAHRSVDPENYVSNFPVHQDGSCNGLQHYAALGRDQHGAESVNLHPASFPRDVYSDVAALVEKERQKDAFEGVELAQLLEGHISRKVVKQTVMTFVYGVTRFGARLQIYKRLKEIDDFPKNKSWAAAAYLTQKTFFSISEMFTETRFIQDWLTDCAKLISKVYGKPVEWTTPLGFPVIQPYHKLVRKQGETFLGLENETNISYISSCDMFQKPNVIKQKNGFPPNFIHSLDSSHMMLTSLFCHREGITFASVHDCYWTHANCVEIMNRICREQFIALHNEPILDDLSRYFVSTYKNMKPIDEKKYDAKKTMLVLGRKLNKGSFDLENVMRSTYFFS